MSKFRAKSRSLQALRWALAFLALFSLSPVSRSAGAGKPANGGFVPGEALLKLKGAASGSAIAQLEQDVDVDEDDEISRIGTASLRRIHSRSKSTDAIISLLRSNPNVLYAEPNYILHADLIPNDPSFGQLWGLRNTGQDVLGTVGTPGADIKAEPAWSLTTGTSTVVVGVVDTGIDYSHPDLAANVWSNPGGIGGCPAGTHGYNAIKRTCDPKDDNNHGSHVSGTIGAVGNNGVGVVGVNWTTSIMGLKFLNASGSGTTANAILAIDFAVNAKIAGINVRALNNSWGGGGFSQALLDEINKAGANDILFVAAAGNSSSNNDVTPHYPSSYGTANEIAVAATDQTDSLASFSNFGPNSVDLGAPGTNILSTVIGGYDYFNGTSMATPHVTGAAALILSKGYQSVTQLKSTILNNVDPLASLSGLVKTGGRLNVCKAIPGCGGPPAPTPTPTPTPTPPAATATPTPTTAPAPDFSLSISPSSASVPKAGGTVSYTVTVARTGGNGDSVGLSVSGLPAGATGVFSPNPIPATGNTSILTVTVSSSTARGSYTFTVTGTGSPSGLTRSATATLVKKNR